MALLSLALGTVLSAAVALAGAAPEAQAAFTEKIVFTSNRTTGTGVNNPTGDQEIFSMKPDGTGLKQLTFNTVDDYNPVLSPDGTKVAYDTYGKQPSNPEGENEIYRVNTLDGSEVKNLSNSGDGSYDTRPAFSPDSTRIAYTSNGTPASNPGGEPEIYRMNVLDGKGKKNLTNSDTGVEEDYPVFSPDGTRIAYQSHGAQTSNPGGESEIYRMNALDGTTKKNLSNNGDGVEDYSLDLSPNGRRIAYTSQGKQASNPEGDGEVYRMNALDGSGQRNLTNNGAYTNDSIPDFSSDGTKVAYVSDGAQTSKPEGDFEIYRMNALDGSDQSNLTDNVATDGIYDIQIRR